MCVYVRVCVHVCVCVSVSVCVCVHVVVVVSLTVSFAKWEKNVKTLCRGWGRAINGNHLGLLSVTPILSTLFIPTPPPSPGHGYKHPGWADSASCQSAICGQGQQ